MDNKELIKKHLERWEGLQTASIEYYAETGKISGHLYKAIEKMLEEKAKEAYSQGVKDWEAANEKANKIIGASTEGYKNRIECRENYFEINVATASGISNIIKKQFKGLASLAEYTYKFNLMFRDFFTQP